MVNKTPEELEQWRQIEQALLGAILPNGDCLDTITGITVKSFQSRKHRIIWAAIEALQKAGIPVNVVTVAEHLSEKGKLTDAGGEVYLASLMDITPNLESVPYFAETILKKQSETEVLLKLEVAREAIKCGQPEAAAQAISDIQHITDQATKQRFEFLTAEGLVTGDFEHNWLIKGVMVSNQLCIMAAQKKCLKTNLSIEIAFCLATGVPFLGKFPIPEAVKVGMIIGESGKATTQETFRRIALSKGWSASQVKNLHFCFDLPSLEKLEDIQQLRLTINELGLKVLFIDPAYLCLKLGDSAKSLFSVGERLQHLLRLGDETGCTIVLIHHTRKSNGINTYAEPELEEIAFAGFQEIARQWILLGRREAYKPDEAGIHKLFFVAGGSSGHSQSWALDINEGSIDDEGGRIWETRLFPTRDARAEKANKKKEREKNEQEAQFESDIAKVVKAMESFAGPCVKSDVKNKATISTTRTSRVLFYLEENEVIENATVKRDNGHKYSGYQLTRDYSERLGILSHTESNDTHAGYSLSIGESVPSGERVHETVTYSDESVPSEYDDIFPA